MNAVRRLDPLWFPYARPLAPKVRLVCCAAAGGSASAFSLFGSHLPATVQLAALQLPGREDRRAEAPFADMAAAVAVVTPVLQELGDLPFALLGHSMGGQLAMALARALCHGGGPRPVHVFLACSPPPHAPDPRRQLHRMTDRELWQKLATLGGTPGDVAADADTMAQVLPVARADLRLSETFLDQGPPLPLPATLLLGRDDTHVPAAEALRSAEAFLGRVRTVTLAGGHFCIRSHWPAVAAEVVADLRTARLAC